MRLDQWLFESGYFESREKARREIMAGLVRRAKSGEVLDKPGWKVPKDLKVELLDQPRFVGRAGEKLWAFLEGFDPQEEWTREKSALDVGSSTGGFSDCLLQRGLKQVACVDVGTHQLHERLRSDSRVQVFEQTDARAFRADSICFTPDLITVDVSFISLRKILPSLLQEFPQSRWILLFKPQFEVPRERKRKKAGVVYEADAREALEEFLSFLRGMGFTLLEVRNSELKGMQGNQEVFVMAQSSRVQAEVDSIFRAYDIRGRADRDLSEALFERIGAVLARKASDWKALPEAEICIGLGSDSRESSPRLVKALRKGLLSHPKVKILSLGELTTPMVYFASHHWNLDAAFQVTASHNPKEDNGIKMMLGGRTLFGDEIRELGVEAQAWTPSKDFARLSQDESRVEDKHQELRAAYLSYLHGQFRMKQKFRVAMDCANGMAGMIVRSALEPYCQDLEILYEEVDCQFPNHPADPTVPAHLEDLQKLVREKNFDLGFAYDGDGDRVGLVAASGRIIWGDEILMLLAEKVLKLQPGASIIGEVKCSEKLFRSIERWGGKPVMYRTGHSLIKKQMKELQAPIAGEMSGHLFFADRYFGFDDAIYASLRVLECLSEMSMSLDEWIEQFPPTFATPEIRVELPASEQAQKIEELRSHFEKVSGVQLSLIDGVRANFSDGSWALVRASNTQSVLVIRLEGSSKERLAELRKQMSEILKQEI